MNYEEALQYSLTVPWKVDLCNSGESCWCRIVLPTETIKYTHRLPDVGLEREKELEWIIPDGSVDAATAQYIVDLHNRSVNIYRSQKKRLQALQNLSDLDQKLGLD